MQIESWMVITGSVVAFVAFIFLVSLILARFYVRASADEALVRTGQGGIRVVIGGGILNLPVIHQVMRVSLRTVTLTVERLGKQALVTKDKIKACCTMELYIRVDSTAESIKTAAQSFGSKNVEAGILSQIVEGKLTDALRGVAAVKDFAELHANRDEFADAVKKALTEELAKNGLKLESTSLTNLCQLPTNEMDPNDVHDAVGLQNITQIVAEAQQRTNQLEKNKSVTIQEQNVKARETALRLEKEQAFLEAVQSREVSERRAAEKADEKKAVLLKEQEAAEAVLEQKRALEAARIAQEQAVEERDLQRQTAIAEALARKEEAEKTAQILATRAIEAAQIEKAQAIASSEIAKQKIIEAAQIEKQKAIETAEVQKKVAIVEADQKKALAEAEKAKAEALETEARESIKTATEKAGAERLKTIELIKADKEAQRSKIDADREAYVVEIQAKASLAVTQRQAESKKSEAEGQANAVRELANAAADKQRAEAQASADAKLVEATANKNAAQLNSEADAIKIRLRAEAEAQAATLDAEAKIKLAQALEKEGQAQAAARRMMVEAENAVDNRILLLRATERAIDKAPEIVKEFVKSAEAIGEMKVLQINGLNSEKGSLGEFNTTPLGMGLTTLLQAAAIAPIAKGLMDHAGISTNDIVETVTSKLKSAAKASVDEFRRAGNHNNSRVEV